MKRTGPIHSNKLWHYFIHGLKYVFFYRPRKLPIMECHCGILRCPECIELVDSVWVYVATCNCNINYPLIGPCLISRLSLKWGRAFPCERRSEYKESTIVYTCSCSSRTCFSTWSVILTVPIEPVFKFAHLSH